MKDRKWVPHGQEVDPRIDRNWVSEGQEGGPGQDVDLRMGRNWVPEEQEVGSSQTGSGSHKDRKWPAARFIHPVPSDLWVSDSYVTSVTPV